MLSKVIPQTFTSTLSSMSLKIALATFSFYVFVQLGLNMVLPFPAYSELNRHDGTVYYAISNDPLPAHPIFTVKRYQRPLLPLIVWALFSWDRHLGFSVVNIIAASIAAMYLWKIIDISGAEKNVSLIVLFATIPFFFGSVHIGLTEPLMMAGLLAGYYYSRRGQSWQSALGYSVAVLAKEIALLPLLAELIIQFRRGGWRAVAHLSVSLIPILVWYALVASRWGNLFWMLGGPEGQLGFGPLAMINIIIHPPDVASVPPIFFVFNQIANCILLLLIALGLYQTRHNKTMMLWVGTTAISLLLLGREVYAYNFDLGRQALPACLLLIEFGGSRFVFQSAFLRPILCILTCSTLFWILYYARFFVYY